jgi:hypothetical protein
VTIRQVLAWIQTILTLIRNILGGPDAGGSLATSLRIFAAPLTGHDFAGGVARSSIIVGPRHGPRVFAPPTEIENVIERMAWPLKARGWVCFTGGVAGSTK